MPEALWQSALAGRMADDTDIEIIDGGPRAMIDLRVAESDEKGQLAVSEALGFDLPTAPRTSTSGENGKTALWLSVDQWLIVAPAENRDALLGVLRGALPGSHAAVTDLSDARTVIRLEGGGAREIVMKGGAANLLSAQFSEGSVRRLTFAGIAAMVHCRSAAPDVLDLYVFRSYADYALRWLSVAARPGAGIRLFTPQPAPPV